MSSNPTATTGPLNTSSKPASPQTTAQVPSSPSRLVRKSSPLPKLNLDDHSPLISTTTTNTSTNAASNPSTAFVFTSSRTFRTLHNLSRPVDDTCPLPPATNVIPSTSSSSSSPSDVPHPTSNRPLLSSAQLAQHSRGAMDARCIVSPNMRAAGFVPLTHSPQHQSPNSSIQSTPLPSPVPTPVDPPNFPPIVFFNPTNVATTSLWDYQYSLAYGLPSSGSSVSDHVPCNDNASSTRLSMRPFLNTKESHSDSSGSGFTPDVASSDSSSNMFFQASPSHSSATSVSSPLQNPDGNKALSQRFQGLHLHGTVDGYPFPETPPRSRTQSRTTASPAIAKSSSISNNTKSGSITPLASPNSPASPPPRLWSGSESGSGTSSSGSGYRSSALPSNSRKSHTSQMSITELCLSSPSAWLGDPEQFVPNPVARGRSGKKSSRMVAGRSYLRQSEVGASAEVSEAMVKEVEPVDVSKPGEKVVGSVDKPSTRNLIDGAVIDEDVEDEVAKEKKNEKHRARERDRDRDNAKERRRAKGKTVMTMSHVSSSPGSSPTSMMPSSPHESKDRPRGKGKDRSDRSDRSRSTKSKALGPTPSFTTWSLPPRDKRPLPPSRPHILGAHDPIMDRERAREEGQFAKDVVMAHRERDREHAKQSGHSSRSSNKMRVAAAPTDAFTTVYDGGRGRGVGRGERGSARGFGRSVSILSAASVLSDGDTMVQSEHFGAIEAVERA